MTSTRRHRPAPVCIAPISLLLCLAALAVGGCAGAERRADAPPPATRPELAVVEQALEATQARAEALDVRVTELERLVLPDAREKDPTYGAEADWVSPIVGGSGGRSFALSCAPGSFVTGLGGRAGAALDRIGPVCQPPLASAQGHGEPTQPGATGGSGGKAYALACPADAVAIGIEGGAGAVVDAVRLLCAPLERTAEGTLRRSVEGVAVSSEQAGGSGGEAFSLRCPDDTAMRGLVGRSGAVIDSLAITCDPL